LREEAALEILNGHELRFAFFCSNLQSLLLAESEYPFHSTVTGDWTRWFAIITLSEDYIGMPASTWLVRDYSLQSTKVFVLQLISSIPLISHWFSPKGDKAA
jgi:hypothetical protein